MTTTAAQTVFVSGTGTGIGKTHFADALIRTLAKKGTVTGWKPVESGAPHGIGEDQARLTAASSKGARTPAAAHLALPLGVSPHLAAEHANVDLPWDAWVYFARSFAGTSEAQVIELAGGLFSPLAPGLDNADFVRRMRRDATPAAKLVLCAVDRLGVLHDVHSSLLAATLTGVIVDAVVLLAPETADASTGTNLRELERTLARRRRDHDAIATVKLFGTVPRLSSLELADHALLQAVCVALTDS